MEFALGVIAGIALSAVLGFIAPFLPSRSKYRRSR